MPRSLDPSSRLTMVLASDVDKNPQPKIFARTLTLNQQRKLMAAMERMQKATANEKIDAALDAAEVCLTGWENMTDAAGHSIQFSREAIGDVLSMEELAEVFSAVSGAGKATVSEKKESGLPLS